ncbi:MULTISPECIES: NUDIX hydrolase [Methylorubrum]|uniref:NUDIX hydrolase n=1 Tax=Methylorubrum extorquens DSM 13060 TaxID=882800 RepID=H1KJK1_METEX|nr:MULTISPECIES: NUDIX domain-containing protein [Methylorubrum]EHP92297.1 NUDIX hydrolase [Methylorubrum extorquens DSM 13060]
MRQEAEQATPQSLDQPDSDQPASPAATPRPVLLRPRDAATLIILDRSRKKLKLLMGRRHAGLAFMGGKFVFPGGRIEPSDRMMPVAGALSQRADDALRAKLPRAPHHLGRSLALAAIRETYEETGLLIGTRDYGPPETAPEGAWQAFADEGVMPDLETLHLVARAITPPKRPRRFDTRFFAVDRKAVVTERPGIVGPDAELTELAWVDLDAARKLDLPRITRVILDDLEAAADAGFPPYRPIPFYFERRGKGVREEI